MIEICPKCRAENSFSSGISHGNIPGISEVSGVFTCKECGYRGIPLKFNEKEYEEWKRENDRK